MEQENIQDQAAEQQQEQGIEQQLNIEQPDLRYKSEIAGLNRKIAEMRKQMEENSMTAEQKAEALRKEREELEQETATLRRNLIIERQLKEYSLPQEFTDRVQGNTEEEIKQDAERFRTFIDNLVHENMKDEINRKLAGKPPRGGETVGKLSYEEITRIPNYKERMRLYRENGYSK
jgi:hypothetical protein